MVLSSHSSIWWWGLGFWWRFPLRVCGGGSFFLFFHSAVGSGFLVAIPSSGLWRWLFFLILRFFHSAVGSGFLVAIPSSGLWRWFSFLILPFGGGVWVFGGDSLFRFVEVVLSSYSSIRRWGLGFWWRFPLRVCGGGSLFSFFHSAEGSGFLVAIPSSGLWRWFSLLILPFGGGVWVFGGDSLFGFVEVVLFFILPFGGGVWVFGGDSLFRFVEVVLSSHSSIWRWG